jgi:uncharacterized protein YgbK (DUF1537 family)
VPERTFATGPLLVLSLSPTLAARAQLRHLAHARTARRVDLSLASAVRDPAVAGSRLGQRLCDELGAASGETVILLGLTGDDELGPGISATVVRDAVLAAVATAFIRIPRPSRVVANGGDAARLIVERWHSGTLEVVGPLAHGAALARCPDGTLLALKSGGFGSIDALTDIVDALAPTPSVHTGDPTS